MKSIFKKKDDFVDEYLDYQNQSTEEKINQKIKELWAQIIQYRHYKFFYVVPFDVQGEELQGGLDKYVDLDQIQPESQQIELIKVQLSLLEVVKSVKTGTSDIIEAIDAYRLLIKNKGDQEVLDIIDKFIFENYEQLLNSQNQATSLTIESQNEAQNDNKSESEKSNYFDKKDEDSIEKVTKKDFDHFKDDVKQRVQRAAHIQDYQV